MNIPMYLVLESKGLYISFIYIHQLEIKDIKHTWRTELADRKC